MFNYKLKVCIIKYNEIKYHDDINTLSNYYLVIISNKFAVSMR